MNAGDAPARCRSSAARRFRSRCRQRGMCVLRRRAAFHRRERQRDAGLGSRALRVLRIRRPKYACRACGTIARRRLRNVRSPAAGDAGAARAGAGDKYCDHTPLYRQSQSSPDTGSSWSALRSPDGSAAPAGGSKRCTICCAKTSSHPTISLPMTRRFPCSIRQGSNENRAIVGLCPRSTGWGGPAPPAAVFLFAPDRKAERPASHLGNFKGVLHVDGYAGFERLTANGDVVLAACWAHTRRKFYEVGTGNRLARGGRGA